MYVCMVITYSRTGQGCQSFSWSAEQGKLIFPCPRACLRIWSRETGSAVPSRVSLLIFILSLNLVLTYEIPPEFRGGVHMKPPYAIGSVLSLSGHAIAYRWRSLPRVRRHRASKPQGSSERVLPWHVTMDLVIYVARQFGIKTRSLRHFGVFGNTVWGITRGGCEAYYNKSL